MLLYQISLTLAVLVNDMETLSDTFVEFHVNGKDTSDFDAVNWFPHKKRALRFSVHACGEVSFKLKNDRQHLFYKIDALESYDRTCIVPSIGKRKCASEKFLKDKDCQKFTDFWITWDLKGNSRLGSGTSLGEKVIIDYNGDVLTSEATRMEVTMENRGGGDVRVYKDGPPEFVKPDPREAAEITITEDDDMTKRSLFNVEFTDPDGDPVTAVVLDDSSPFALVDDELINVTPLDFEAQSCYHVTLTIHDGYHFVNTTLFIRVTNEYDEAPELHATPITIPEELPVGMYIDGGYTVTDSDIDDQLTYTLSGSDSTYFSINTTSGKLKMDKRIDLEALAGRSVLDQLVLSVVDKGGLSTTSSLVVNVLDINDEYSTCSKPHNKLNVSENSTTHGPPEFVKPDPTEAAEITITEDDDKTYRSLFNVEFTDPNGDPVTAVVLDGSSPFALVDDELINVTPLDFEAQSCYHVTLTIHDGYHFVNTTLFIRVTNAYDEAPQLHATPITIPEELPVGMYIDGGYTVTDQDIDDQLTYTLSGSDSTYFSINATSGKLTVDKRIDLEAFGGRGVLDQLVLSVVDKGGLSATSSLVVNVLDINDEYPTFSEPHYRVNVSENSTTQLLVSLVATDADHGNNGNISMAIVDGDDPVSNKFVLSGTELSALGSAIDYESLQDMRYSYVLTIEAKDNPFNEAPKTGRTTVIVSVLPVNEHAPVWGLSMLESGRQLPDLRMMENTTVGSELLTLKATDVDHGQDGVVTYHILSVTTDTGVSLPGLLTVDSVTGVVRVIQSLDYDIVLGSVHYLVEVAARDGGDPSLEIKGTFKIIVDNVNDNPPVFLSSDYQVDVSEAVPPGTVIHTFTSGSDLDGDAITYSVIGGNSHMFEINGTDVKTLLALDFETASCHYLYIMATEGLYDVNITMIIKVTDVIDETPVITVYNPLYLLEEQPLGTVIGWVFDVVDADANDVLQYSIKGSGSSHFHMNASTGRLSMTTRLSSDGLRRAIRLDDVIVTANDSGGLSASATLTFTIVNVRDNTPRSTASRCRPTLPATTPTSSSSSDVISPEETWAMRIIVMTLAVTLLGATMYICRLLLSRQPVNPSRPSVVKKIEVSSIKRSIVQERLSRVYDF